LVYDAALGKDLVKEAPTPNKGALTSRGVRENPETARGGKRLVSQNK